VGATLWDPLEIIEANGGTPPLTYAQFCHVTLGVGPPPRPCPDVDLGSVTFASLPEELLAEMRFYTAVPTPEMLGFVRTIEKKVYRVRNSSTGTGNRRDANQSIRQISSFCLVNLLFLKMQKLLHRRPHPRDAGLCPHHREKGLPGTYRSNPLLIGMLTINQ
jgi:hypothetical protein